MMMRKLTVPGSCGINEIFADDELDFIGGPYSTLGRAPPHVAAQQVFGVIGAFNLGSEPRSYARTPSCRGNAVVRRSNPEKLMPYSTGFGATGDHYLADETGICI